MLTLKTSLKHLYELKNSYIVMFLNNFTKHNEDKSKPSSTLFGNIIWTQSDCDYTLYKHNLKKKLFFLNFFRAFLKLNEYELKISLIL